MKNIKQKPSIVGHDIHYVECFACSPKNELGLQADVTFNDDLGIVEFYYTAGDNHQGALGYQHGGISSTLLDEAQGLLCGHLGYIVMTHILNVQYYKAIPVHQKYLINAKITKISKKRLYTSASIQSIDKSITYVKSSGSFYIINEKIIDRVLKNTKFLEEHFERIGQIGKANQERFLKYNFEKEKNKLKFL